MKKIKYIILLVLLINSLFVLAQKRNMLKGDDFFNKRMYKEAIDCYQLALNEKIVFNKYEMTKRVAQTYKMLFDYQKATEWYEKLSNIDTESEHNFKFDYAMLLCNMGKYEDAKPIFKKYFAEKGLPAKYKDYENNCNWAISNRNIENNVQIYKTNIETGSRSLGLAFFKDGVVYAKPQTQEFDKKTVFYDLVYVKKIDTSVFDVPIGLNGEINRSFYEASPSFSSDNLKLYYTGNAAEIIKYTEKNAQKKNLQISKEGVNILKIYQATYQDGQWLLGKELDFNSKEYDCAFPHITNDGNKLYFVSNMSGGFGGFDVYVVHKETDSTWSLPINLGADINSELDEMYPYENNDTLYYSSKGKAGFGGADIFKSHIDKGIYTQPVNLGKPYNSSKDDFSYVVDNNKRMGYFSSNRVGNNGYDHIFEFYVPELPDTIRGFALNKITLKPIREIEVSLYRLLTNLDPQLVNQFLTNAKGEVTLILEKHVKYQVIFKHPGFTEQGFEIPEEFRNDVIAKFGELFFVPIPKKNTIIQIDNIYFDYNKSTIKEESFPVVNAIAEYLNSNIEVSVELSAHTDSRGTDSYNLKLSSSRAKSVVEYLVKKGISPTRLIPKGYGETKLVNRCANNVQCTEEEHQQNRRVELKIL